MNELRRRREQRIVSVVGGGLVNPVSPEVTGRISGRERDGQLRKIEDRGERELVASYLRLLLFELKLPTFINRNSIDSYSSRVILTRNFVVNYDFRSNATLSSSVYICFAILWGKKKKTVIRFSRKVCRRR